MSARSSGVIGAMLLLSGAVSPRASASQSIDRLASAGDHLFALAGSDLLFFDGAGQALGRCARFAPPPQREKRTPIGAPDPQQVLRAAGLRDNDDSTPEAEDALDDEGLGPPRRPRPARDLGIVPRAIAADAAGGAWIATSAGIFHGDGRACSPAGLDGRDLLLVAAGGGTAVAASDELLFRADGDGAPGTFAVVAGLTARPRALAIAADGAALVADDDGVSAIGREGVRTRLLDRGADALAVCDGVAVALARDGVYRWTPGAAPTRVADRPPIRTIACGPDAESRWIATGVGVWTSPDAASWRERRETLGRSVRGATVAGGRIWLATGEGLIALDPHPREEDDATPAPWTVPGIGFAPLHTGRWARPRVTLPLITAVVDARETVDRRAFAVMVYLTFPFDRLTGGRIDPTRVAGELVQRDEVLAREQTQLEQDAPIDAAAAARLEAVLAEREALR
ncbi:MAG TPA: hypothetical protein VHG72_12615 [Polyangia bacterium]|nr:hypothetical protein [Polyangia bacterium]